MNFLKRAVTSVIRKPGKTIILLVLVFVLGNIIAGAVSVKEAIINTQTVVMDKIGVTVGIGIDYDALYNASGDYQIDSLGTELIETIGQSDYVKYYDYSSYAYLETKAIKSYQSDEMQEGVVTYDMSIGGSEDSAYFSVMGGQKEIPLVIEQGSASLYQGKGFSQEAINNGDGEILISKELAEANQLQAGSKIMFYQNIYQYDTTDFETMTEEEMNQYIYKEPEIVDTVEIELSVAGIFEPKKETSIDENGQVVEQMSGLENMIYATNAFVNKFNKLVMEAEIAANPSVEPYNYTYYESSFILKDPRQLEEFREIESAQLPEFYMFTDNAEEFNTLTAPMDNMEWIANVVLYVAIGATILILSLLITLFLKDRKREIGIYLSLGERKRNIIGQILVEVLSISIIAITLSLFTGNMLADQISTSMLENQIQREQENQNDDIYYGGVYYYGMSTQQSMTTEELVESYQVAFSLRTVLFFYFIGIGTVLVSTLIPILYTMRLNPKKILM